MDNFKRIKFELRELAKSSPQSNVKWFKTGKGDYAEHDKFYGISTPELRRLAKSFDCLKYDEIQRLIRSAVNDERFVALVILIAKYNKGGEEEKVRVFDFYLKNIKYVNNWNLVDASAHLIVGEYLLKSNKVLLLDLAKSDIMWERRIAIVSTWQFIRNNKYSWTLKLAKILLNDEHDLIHKAVGWMLREVGKGDQKTLEKFLDGHCQNMPRTMLRYAIEKFDEDKRKAYLLRK